MQATIDHLAHYFERFDCRKPHILSLPSPGLQFCIVIPCFNEPDLLTTLESLYRCAPPECHGEVIIHINATKNAPANIKQRNKTTYREAERWIEQHPHQKLDFHLIYSDQLPDKDAGPGLARKIGMDEAVHRFLQLDRPEGAIISLDADCTVAPNYLQVLEKQFIQQPLLNGCNIYFEHPLVDQPDEQVVEGIMHYELFLRYYRQALRYSGFPYPFHTIGSCMAVRAKVYAKQGGMNKNKGGEDFYFLHKIFPLGRFTELTDTTVYPQARKSDRVPYGTGQAILEHINNKNTTFPTFSLQAFEDLKMLFNRLPEYFAIQEEQLPERLGTLSHALQAFLKQEQFKMHWKEIRANTTQFKTFKKRYFNWMDGMKVLKYCRFTRSDEHYGTVALEKACSVLLEQLNGQTAADDASVQQLLQTYRKLDREQPLKSE